MTHCNRIRHSRDRDGDAVPGARTFASCRRHRRRQPDAMGSSGVGRRDVVDLIDASGARRASTDIHQPAPGSRPRTRAAARARTRSRRGPAADPATGTGAGDGTPTNPGTGTDAGPAAGDGTPTNPGAGTGTGPAAGDGTPTSPGAGRRSVLGRAGRSNLRPMSPARNGISAGSGPATAPTTGPTGSGSGPGPEKPGLELDTSPDAAAPRRLGSRPVRSARSAAAALASLATHRSPLWRPRP